MKYAITIVLAMTLVSCNGFKWGVDASTDLDMKKPAVQAVK